MLPRTELYPKKRSRKVQMPKTNRTVIDVEQEPFETKPNIEMDTLFLNIECTYFIPGPANIAKRLQFIFNQICILYKYVEITRFELQMHNTKKSPEMH